MTLKRIAGLRRLNPGPFWLVRWPRRGGGRAEDLDPEALAGSGSAAHVRCCRQRQLTCLGGLTAGGDVLLELPGRQHQAAHGCAGAHPVPVRYPPGQQHKAAGGDAEHLVSAVDLGRALEDVEGLVLVVVDVQGAGEASGVDELGQGEPAVGVFPGGLERHEVAEEPVGFAVAGIESIRPVLYEHGSPPFQVYLLLVEHTWSITKCRNQSSPAATSRRCGVSRPPPPGPGSCGRRRNCSPPRATRRPRSSRSRRGPGWRGLPCTPPSPASRPSSKRPSTCC